MSAECTSTIAASDRVRLHRRPDRGSYERAELDAILDAALVCHVGFVHDRSPVVIPTIHARAGDLLYLHGSPASRMLRDLAGGVDVCVTATLVDGLVLAKSWMHHSLNYRSAVVMGRAHRLDGPEKVEALRVVVEHVQPGRAAESRPPSPKELTATLVLALPITEFSVKIRTGGPIDDPEDSSLDWFAGVTPVPPHRLGAGE
jgi:nitroimidazol reductase NimA-like FMN-containing flavoprotein (pyridoxamine 5'-phosphate oxidase superfamily)